MTSSPNSPPRKRSIPSWGIAWISLVTIGMGLYFWAWLSSPSNDSTPSLVMLELPSVAKDFNENDPFLPSEDVHRTPVSEKYAGPQKGTRNDYRVSVIVTNLGLDKDLLTQAAEELPVEVDFALRADTPHLQDTIDDLRATGREVLLMIPMEPDGYPHNDPGPNPLLTSNTTEENLKRIAYHTERALGIIGFGPFMGEAFTRNEFASEPIASWISKNGYALLDFTDLQERSQFVDYTIEYGGTYIDNPVVLTKGLSDDHMKLIKLEYMETVSKRERMSVGVIEACPEAIPLLNNWFKTLPEKRIILTPTSSAYMPDAEGNEQPRPVPVAATTGDALSGASTKSSDDQKSSGSDANAKFGSSDAKGGKSQKTSSASETTDASSKNSKGSGDTQKSSGAGTSSSTANSTATQTKSSNAPSAASSAAKPSSGSNKSAGGGKAKGFDPQKNVIKADKSTTIQEAEEALTKGAEQSSSSSSSGASSSGSSSSAQESK